MKMLEQFEKFKERFPETIFLFRKGDFYIAYEEDADTCSHDLGITATLTDNATECRPYKSAMFPLYALDTYLPRLIRAGHKIAICEDFKEGKR